MRVARAFLIGLMMFLMSGAAWALAGRPSPWQIDLQDAVTPSAHGITWLYNYLLIILAMVVVFVMVLLAYVMIRFNAKANPVPSKTTHNTMIEVLWTIIPVIILVVIAIPAFRLLYLQRDIPATDMTIKVIGNASWNWTYEYPELGMNQDGTAKVSFTSYLLARDAAEKAGKPYLLATDVPLVAPVNKTVKLIVTADPEGIIHSWTIPSFGMKIDAIPGRLNEDWFRADKIGVYYGQCSELCGKDHAYMPIEVHIVSQADYDIWAEKIKVAGAEEAAKFLAARETIEKLAQARK